MKNLTIKEAFEAMRIFLEKYYERTKSDDVGSLLGDLIFFDGNETMDPAAWHDWLDSINQVLKKEKEKNS